MSDSMADLIELGYNPSFVGGSDADDDYGDFTKQVQKFMTTHPHIGGATVLYGGYSNSDDSDAASDAASDAVSDDENFSLEEPSNAPLLDEISNDAAFTLSDAVENVAVSNWQQSHSGESSHKSYQFDNFNSFPKTHTFGDSIFGGDLIKDIHEDEHADEPHGEPHGEPHDEHDEPHDEHDDVDNPHSCGCSYDFIDPEKQTKAPSDENILDELVDNS